MFVSYSKSEMAKRNGGLPQLFGASTEQIISGNFSQSLT
jgi:hypothetical protein